MIILFCILLIIIILSLIKVRARFIYDENGAMLYLRALFFKKKIDLSNIGNTDKSEQNEKKQKKENHKKGRELPPLFKLFDLACDTLGRLTSKVRVDLLKAEIIVASEDAFETAMRYGEIGSGVSALLAGAENVFDIRNRDIVVEADFSAKEIRATVDLMFSISLLSAISVAFFAVSGFMRLTKNDEDMDNKQDFE